MSNRHYFIAVSLPNELKCRLAEWQKRLSQCLSYKQWPYHEDFHITLKFLGAVDDKTIDAFHQKLTSLSSLEPFYTAVQSIQTFGNKTRPRVVWAGVHLNSQLSCLHKKVEAWSEELGFPKESKRYIPHITLAKKWSHSVNQILFEKIKEELENVVLALYIDEVILYEIHPKNNPKYKVIANYRLGGVRKNSGTID